MDPSVYGEVRDSEKISSSKKVYALVLLVIILLGVIGFMIYSSLGGVLPFVGETVTNDEQAANTLSDLGNDISGISDELKEMENVL